MTIREAIDRIDALKPNAFEASEKVSWLSRLDCTIFKEIISTHDFNTGETPVTEFSGYTNDTDESTVLLAEAPYDEVYLRYMETQIDYALADYDRFNNSNMMYAQTFNSFRNYYNRTHMPKETRNVYF